VEGQRGSLIVLVTAIVSVLMGSIGRGTPSTGGSASGVMEEELTACEVFTVGRYGSTDPDPDPD
jgi:hypothetical protein